MKLAREIVMLSFTLVLLVGVGSCVVEADIPAEVMRTATFTVTDEAGTPIPQAQVTLSGQTRMTGDDGVAQFSVTRSQEERTFAVSKDGYRSIVGQVIVSIDTRRTVRLVELGQPTEDTEEPIEESEVEPVRITHLTTTGYQEENPATNAVDGNMVTRWSANTATNDGSHYIELELSESTYVETIQVAWYRGAERETHFAIATSNGGAFTTHHEGTADQRAMHTYEIGREARTIRITGFGNSENAWVGVSDVRINEESPDTTGMQVTNLEETDEMCSEDSQCESGYRCTSTGACEAIEQEPEETEEPIGEEYTLSVTGALGVRVLSDPEGINCNPDCSASFEEGTVVTLSTEPIGTNNAFAGWSGACTGNSCTVTMDESRSVQASSERIAWPVYIFVREGAQPSSPALIGAVVSFNGEEKTIESTSAVVFPGTPAGTHSYSVSHPSFTTKSGTITVNQEEVNQGSGVATYMHFSEEDRKEPSGPIGGLTGDALFIVRTASTPTSPISGAVVTMSGPMGGTCSETNQAGTYLCANRIVGDYTYEVSGTGYETASGSIHVESNGRTTTVTLQAVSLPDESELGSVQFTVRRAGFLNTLLEGATVTIQRGGQQHTCVHRPPTNAWRPSGEYNCDDVPAGDYTYTVVRTGYETASGAVDVTTSGSTMNVELTPVTSSPPETQEPYARPYSGEIRITRCTIFGCSTQASEFSGSLQPDMTRNHEGTYTMAGWNSPSCGLTVQVRNNGAITCSEVSRWGTGCGTFTYTCNDLTPPPPPQ